MINKEILKKYSEEERELPITVKELQNFILIPILEDQKQIGFFAASEKGKETVCIQRVYLLPDYRDFSGKRMAKELGKLFYNLSEIGITKKLQMWGKTRSEAWMKYRKCEPVKREKKALLFSYSLKTWRKKFPWP